MTAGIGLYVHLPFCRVKCPYCDFYTYPARGEAETGAYVRAVRSEITRADAGHINTIYFGGGTPSVVPGELLREIMGTIRGAFEISPDAEATIEINPEDVTEEAARAWRESGFNRASLGVQSLHDEELTRLKRSHRAADSRRAFERLRKAGFGNVGVDLIFGLEGQDPSRWESTLSGVLAWGPDHLSAYNLILEEKTRFASEFRLGSLHLPKEEEQLRMFSAAEEGASRAGLARYEISNFARPGFESRHNRIYWTGGEYLGIGVSAHSFRSFTRWWNARSVPKYVEADGDAIEGRETISPEQHWNERWMTGLRLTEGVDLSALSRELEIPPSKGFGELIDELAEAGYLARDGSRISLTERGIPLSDEIFLRLTQP